MAVPLAAIASLAPLAAKIPGLLKSLYSSKAFLPALATTAFLGGDVLRETGKAGERDILRAQLALQGKASEVSEKAQKKLLTESRTQTKKYLEELAKTKREEMKREYDRALMQTFIGSMDRQAAITAQAIQGVSQINNSGTSAPAGLIDIMRSTF